MYTQIRGLKLFAFVINDVSAFEVKKKCCINIFSYRDGSHCQMNENPCSNHEIDMCQSHDLNMDFHSFDNGFHLYH